MKIQFFCLIFLIVIVSSCSKNTLKGTFSNGNYQYRLWGGSEFESDCFEFKKNNLFEYSRKFCLIVEYGFGNYEINKDKIIFKFQHRDTTGYNIKVLSERKDSILEVIVKNDLVKNFNRICNDTTVVDYSITTMYEKFPKFGFDENKFFKKDSILLLKNKDLKSLYFSNCIDNINVPISKDFSGKSLRIELQFSDNGDKVISDKIREFNF